MIRNPIHKIVISCAPSTAPFLAEEVQALNYTVLQINPTDVVTEGNMEDCMRLNLHLRTAHRVLLVIKELQARTADQLYEKAKEIPWETFIEEDGFFSIDSFVRNESIRDYRFASLRLKDAIADRFLKKFGKRPDSGKEKDQTVLFMHWVDSNISLAIDTSGETLAKHGYRLMPWKAPLLESMAASIIIASKWDKQSHFVNPMCGSGTLAIEAALIALNMPPGLLRDNYGFMHLKGYNSTRWRDLLEEAKQGCRNGLDLQIIATDNNPLAIAAAKENARNAGVEKYIDFLVCDFQETPIPEPPGTVILNPEWGERLGEQEDLIPLYKLMGDFFKTHCSGYWGYILTGNLNLAKKVGLRTKRRIELNNSKIETRLLEYELYKGTKRIENVDKT